jgi:hypothetical protein
MSKRLIMSACLALTGAIALQASYLAPVSAQSDDSSSHPPALPQPETEIQRLQTQVTKLELKNKIDNLQQQQQQRGISDSTKQIGLGTGQTGTTFGALTTVPIESKILVFQSSNEVAQIIARDIIETATKSPIQSLVVYSKSEFAQLNSYRLYNSVHKALVAAYKDAGVTIAPPKSTQPGSSRGIDQPTAPLQISTTVMRSVAELLAYFRSEDTIHINEFAPSDQNFLVAQLVAALRKKQSAIKVYAPSVYLMNTDRPNGPTETFLSELNELAKLKAQALARSSSDPRQATQLQQLNIQADLLLDLLNSKDFSPPLPLVPPRGGESVRPGVPTEPPSRPSDPSNGARLAQLIQGAEISALLNSRDKQVLVVNLIASGGSSRTRRSLFSTMFTGQSVSYSGGVAVEYFLVNPDNSFAAGDVIYRSSGFKTMRGPIGNR